MSTHLLAGNYAFDCLILNLLQQIFLILGPPRCIIEQHLVQDNSKCPDIALKGVLILLEGLRCHVKRRADIVLAALGQRFHLHSKAKISDFDLLSLSYQDIGWF